MHWLLPDSSAPMAYCSSGHFATTSYSSPATRPCDSRPHPTAPAPDTAGTSPAKRAPEGQPECIFQNNRPAKTGRPLLSRGGRTRTGDPTVPNRVRYRTALHPDHLTCSEAVRYSLAAALHPDYLTHSEAVRYSLAAALHPDQLTHS